MREAYRSGAVSDAPPSSGASSVGFPNDDTVPGAYWYHSVSQEIINVILRANLTPDGADLTQLRQAVDALITAGVAGVTIPPGITLATTPEHLQANPPSDEAATPAGLRAMLDDLFPNTDGRAEFTTAGTHSYDWEWDVTRGIAVIDGAGGGGGGAHGPGNANAFPAAAVVGQTPMAVTAARTAPSTMAERETAHSAMFRPGVMEAMLLS